MKYWNETNISIRSVNPGKDHIIVTLNDSQTTFQVISYKYTIHFSLINYNFFGSLHFWHCPSVFFLDTLCSFFGLESSPLLFGHLLFRIRHTLSNHLKLFVSRVSVILMSIYVLCNFWSFLFVSYRFSPQQWLQ